MSIQYHKCNQEGCDGVIAFENADFNYKKNLAKDEYILYTPICSKCKKKFRVAIHHILIEVDEDDGFSLVDVLPETGWKKEYDI